MTEAPETHRAIDAVWRIESPRLIAAIAGVVRDNGLAEEVAQDALVAALEQWPESGVPRNPGAWLMAIGKRRAIDHLRRQERFGRKLDEIGRTMETETPEQTDEVAGALDREIQDDLLRLIFTACHPALPAEGRVALTLRVVGGLTTDEIARAYLVSEATVAQWIVRAKRTLAAAHVPFEVPAPPERPPRLASVLEVIYLIFNEGYSATAGFDWLRPELCDEALRLGRTLVELMPEEAEVHGLVALMEIQASRSAARTGPSGEPVLLLDQDRQRWNRLLIPRGLAALERAEALAGNPGAPHASGQELTAQTQPAAETPLGSRGQDWITLGHLVPFGATQVAVSPDWPTDRTLIAIRSGGAFHSASLVQSTDGGEHWQAAGQVRPASTTQLMLGGPSDRRVLFAKRRRVCSGRRTLAVPG